MSQASGTPSRSRSRTSGYPEEPFHLSEREVRVWLTGVPFLSGINGKPLPSWTPWRRALAEGLARALEDLRSVRRQEADAAQLVEHHLADPRFTPARHARLEKKVSRARMAVRESQGRFRDALNGFLAAGLEYRCPAAGGANPSPFGTHLWNEDRVVYRKLIAAGSTLPRGVGVCEDCHIVFRVRRKGFAAKCPRCHATPVPRPTRQHQQLGTVPAGVAREVFDPETLDPAGWRVVHVHRCRNCGKTFSSRRRDAQFCCDGCRLRSHRAADK